MKTLELVAKEIVDLHDFFTEWFNGTAARDQLEPRFVSRLHKDVQFIPPEGHVVGGEALKEGIARGYGTNANFRSHIRDVNVRYERGDLVLATYTEFQTGAKVSAEARNARITTVLIEMNAPLTFLHIQETWLPASVRDAGMPDL
ncbi:hypothetical protein [uncultured Tateyamaria sp.]|uniref:hypothetical protein n=1 Tax=uncultured Tateyamaria sp. TaxID=455651 RepID=UPI0026129535|nr:hypothetical protein [uncultured Tateyamaria sp.]